MSDSKKHHHVLSTRAAVVVFAALLVLTVLTVVLAHVNLGPLNFPIAMTIATAKALLVLTVFMNLAFEREGNGMLFGTSFLFLAIFLVLTSTDLFFRGDVYVKGPLVAQAAETPAVKGTPWVPTPQMVAHGKEIFSMQCTPCHGPQGKGDGPAAAALNPRPRNFTQDQGWKNGRKPSQIFKTLKEGLPGSAMASFATMPLEDRWALADYVNSLGPNPPKDSPEDLAKVGVNPKTGAAGGGAEPSIPVEFAIDRMVQETARGK